MPTRLLFVFLSALFIVCLANPISSQTETTESFAIKPGQAVYIVAVKGDCGVIGGVTVVNGQPMLLPRQAGDQLPKRPQKMLTRYEPFTGADETLRQVFAKDKTFVVADSLEKADFVFHVCGSFTEAMLPRLLIQRRQIPSDLIVAQARVVPASIYRKYVASQQNALAAAMWKAVTPDPNRPLKKEATTSDDKKKKKDAKAEPRRPSPDIRWDSGPLWSQDSMTPEVKPARLEDLVRYFLKDYAKIKPLTLSKVVLPPVASANEPIRPAFTNKPEEVQQEKRRPTLVNKQESQEATDKTETKPAADTEEVIKIDTSLIYVPVRVMDKDGKYIPDLQARDFQIYEDGIAQEIESFSSVDDPFNVVLLLDISGSTRFKIEDIQDAAITFTEQLRPQDRVMVVSFDQKVWVDCEFTNDRTQLMKAILRTRTGGSTSVYDAMDLVLTERLNQIQGRKAIVLFSDGVDTSSHLATLQSTIERVEESNSIVYTVHYDTQNAVNFTPPLIPNVAVAGVTKLDYERAEKYMQELAKRSGGRFYEAATLGDAKQAFASIAEELRRQYGLGYYSKNEKHDGSYRKIRVRVENANWAVRSREGYRAPKSRK